MLILPMKSQCASSDSRECFEYREHYAMKDISIGKLEASTPHYFLIFISIVRVQDER